MIIFELDGVLADIEHRRHFVAGYEKRWVDEEEYFGPEFKGQCGYHWFNKDGTVWDGKKDYQAYYEACEKDEPIKQVCEVFLSLAYEPSTREVVIWSSRCESTREKTVKWIEDNIPEFERWDYINRILKMRPIGLDCPAHRLKEHWLIEYAVSKTPPMKEGESYKSGDLKYPVDMVFESDPESIAMYRRRGIFVFDCRQNK